MTEIQALVLSCAVESPIAYLIARVSRWTSRGPRHVAAASAVATAVTHPQLWTAALWAFPRFTYWPSALTLEAVVVLVEGGLICWMAQMKPSQAMLVSLAANTGSMLVGLMVG